MELEYKVPQTAYIIYMMKFDDYIVRIGEYGRYQQIQCGLLYLIMIPMAFQLYTLSIISSTPKYRCSIPNYGNDSYSSSDPIHEGLIKEYIPTNNDGSWTQCSVYNKTDVTADNITTCDDYVYDYSVFQSSIVESMSLTCDEYYLKTTSDASYMIGGIVGSLFLGRLCDVYGRKIIMLSACMLVGVFGIGTAWSSNIVALIIIRIMLGGADCIAYISAVLISIEIVGPNKRNMVNHLCAIFFGLSVGILMSFAPFYHDWRWLQTTVSLFNFLLIPLFWFLNESPRWLLTRGRVEEAKIIMKKMAHTNKNNVTKDNLCVELEEEIMEENHYQWKDVFSSTKVVFQLFALGLNWFAVAMLYYGIGLGMDNLDSKNYYRNLAIAGLVEVPGCCLSWFFSYKIGRKRTYSLLVIFTSISLLCTVFPVYFGNKDHVWIIVTLALIGKCLGSGAYACIYLYTPELLPTSIRSTGTAVCNFSSILGAAAAPYIADTGAFMSGSFGRIVHLLIIGGLSVLAAVLNLTLVETKDTNLPDTLGQAVSRLNRNTNKNRNKEQDQKLDQQCPSRASILLTSNV